ncbi:hypothetical protein DPMN_050962 [Dreissena polymorpha]|uniref:Uncharacterized protein n=1 Tax=Dreissena polymorpha TaxID=45954 RepID=A0A9D4CI67_DREPO|nr:hypothetical protein DPMN_050962 [Dreissena polymorpha]
MNTARSILGGHSIRHYGASFPHDAYVAAYRFPVALAVCTYPRYVASGDLQLTVGNGQRHSGSETIIYTELNDIPEENHILAINNNQGNDDYNMDRRAVRDYITMMSA